MRYPRGCASARGCVRLGARVRATRRRERAARDTARDAWRSSAGVGSVDAWRRATRERGLFSRAIRFGSVRSSRNTKGVTDAIAVTRCATIVARAWTVDGGYDVG